MKHRLRVVIAEPSAIVADGLRMMLDEAGGFQIAGTVSDPVMLDERLKVLDADIVIINPSMIDVRRIRSLRSMMPSLHTVRLAAVVYSVFDDEFLRKFDTVFKIVDSPSSIIAGLRRLSEAAPDSRADAGYELTEREEEILVSVARGLANKEIADKHHISIHTVISHRKNIARKTGIKTVAGLTVYALLNNLIDGQD